MIYRSDVAARFASFGNAENESYGIEYGYAYEESPVICAERGADIPNDPLRYTPTTFPGYTHDISRRADAECGA